MPKLSTRPPKYSHHKASGQATVKFNGRVRYLGPYGSQESKTRYQEAIVEWGRQQEQTPTLAAAMAIGSLGDDELAAIEVLAGLEELSLNYTRISAGTSGTVPTASPVGVGRHLHHGCRLGTSQRCAATATTGSQQRPHLRRWLASPVRVRRTSSVVPGWYGCPRRGPEASGRDGVS